MTGNIFKRKAFNIKLKLCANITKNQCLYVDNHARGGTIKEKV